MSVNPPGWYPDPVNPLQERLWDGSDWVDRVRPRSTAPADEKEEKSVTGLTKAEMRELRRMRAVVACVTVAAVAGALVWRIADTRDPSGNEVTSLQPVEEVVPEPLTPQQFSLVDQTLRRHCSREFEIQEALLGAYKDESGNFVRESPERVSKRLDWLQENATSIVDVHRYWAKELGSYASTMRTVAAAVQDDSMRSVMHDLTGQFENEAAAEAAMISRYEAADDKLRASSGLLGLAAFDLPADQTVDALAFYAEIADITGDPSVIERTCAGGGEDYSLYTGTPCEIMGGIFLRDAWILGMSSCQPLVTGALR